jgi:hypothetical protein
MTGERDFQSVYNRLKELLKKYEPELQLKVDSEGKFSLDAAYSQQYKREMFFGSVTIGKRYVSYHLMPVYVFPELLDSLSPQLKKRMQGKSCFNFNKVDEALFEELAHLTQAGFKRYQEEGLI